MQCYMMSRLRAQALAEALRRKYRHRRKAIDVESVRMYCITNAEQEREPLDARPSQTKGLTTHNGPNLRPFWRSAL